MALRSSSAVVAGRRLGALLSSPPYRTRWQRHVRHHREGPVNQAAVARVIAEHLLDTGARPLPTAAPDRHLKDRVARALGGSTLSPETLEWFIDAFGFSPGEADALWRDLRGAPAYRNVTLHELHTVGADGLPESHRTLQVIEAVEATIEQYTYRVDTSVAAVEVVRGGRAGPLYDAGGGLHAVDIALTAPIEPGETASLEYLTTFRYLSPPPPELRRSAGAGVERLEIHVRFSPLRLPGRIEWGTWGQLDGPFLAAAEVALDPEHSVHRMVTGGDGGLVGFTWWW